MWTHPYLSLLSIIRPRRWALGGLHIRTRYRWWWLRNAALSYEMQRQVEGTVEADELYHTAGQKGQAKQGGKKCLGRRPRCRRKKREPGRGHYDKDRPAMIAWVSRQGMFLGRRDQECYASPSCWRKVW
jgi:hypothetical protein